jgi:Cyclin
MVLVVGLTGSGGTMIARDNEGDGHCCGESDEPSKRHYTLNGQDPIVNQDFSRKSESELEYDSNPFSYLPTLLVSGESVDLDQLDAGDMFPDDSDDIAQEENGQALHARQSLLCSDEYDDNLSSLAPPSSDKYLGESKMKGVDIRKPQILAYSSSTPASSVLSITSGAMASNSSSFLDGSLRPVLYSAINSLEHTTGTSFNRFKSHQKISETQGLASEQMSALPSTTNVKNTNIEKTSNFTFDNIPENKSRKKEKSHPTVPQLSNGLHKLDEHVTAKEIQKLTPSPSKHDALRPLDGSNTPPTKRNQRTRRKLKKVTIHDSKQPKEIFRLSSDAYTPRVAKKNFKFKPAEMRTPVPSNDHNMGTLSRPNFRDALRRVAMIMKQHIIKIEQRFEENCDRTIPDGLFRASMLEAFSDENFSTARYRCTMVRLPMAHPGMIYGLRKVQAKHTIPSEEEIYEFGHQLFKSVQLSSECSIVCLIYIERLMEVAKVPLVSRTWRTIFMCGLLLASKVWQDLSSWNIEFATVYPQYSLESINRLEVQFLKMIKWDLYISSSLYAKYYFALRSIVEKQDFRMRYNRMVVGVGNVDASEALKIQQRSEMVKEEALLLFSRSM